MVGADDLLAASSGGTDGGEMVHRVDHVTAERFVSDVTRADGFDDAVGVTNQETAALLWRGFARMVDDGGCDAVRQRHTSITIAIPIPPPIQRLATPRPPPRFFRA